MSETCTNADNGNWYTHPAFSFGNQELTGFWIGKLEISTTDEACNTLSDETNCNKVSTVTIKPNVNNWQYANAYNYFTSIQNISSDYNLTNADSHMIKNMEWGAVAYLKQSKYGLGLTDIGINNSSYLTGCGAATGISYSTECNSYNTTNGMLASTTGNIYGIYDMSGGAAEYTMAIEVDVEGKFYNDEFMVIPESKYYDKYMYMSNFNHKIGKLGDATKETLRFFGSIDGGWYGNFSDIFGGNFFTRGSTYSTGGIFEFSRSNGYVNRYLSSRAILVRK